MIKNGKVRKNSTIGIYTKEQRDSDSERVRFWKTYSGEKCKYITYFKRVKRGIPIDIAVLPIKK